MFEKIKMQRLKRKIDSLPQDKKEKLKRILETKCIHGVLYTREIPCLKCLESSDMREIIKSIKL